MQPATLAIAACFEIPFAASSFPVSNENAGLGLQDKGVPLISVWILVLLSLPVKRKSINLISDRENFNSPGNITWLSEEGCSLANTKAVLSGQTFPTDVKCMHNTVASNS